MKSVMRPAVSTAANGTQLLKQGNLQSDLKSVYARNYRINNQPISTPYNTNF